MTNSSATYSFSVNNVTLHGFLVSLQGDQIPEYANGLISEAFHHIAPYLSDSSQVIYLRDIKSLAIDGKYPGGHCFNRSEAMIAVPSWDVDKRQLIATVNHELHHMARWQNAGYGETLGGAILSEGIATYYEALRSGWKAPWHTATVTQHNIAEALTHWDNADYDYNNWFFEGKSGRWVGYGLGVKLASKLYESGFDLENSLKITADQARSVMEGLAK